MSESIVEVCQIENVVIHPDPEVSRLCIGIVKGWQTIIAKKENGEPQFLEGEKVVFVPPNTVVLPEVAEELAITNYLSKRIDIDGNRVLVVKAIKLKGEPSFGLLVKPKDDSWEIGKDVSEEYGFSKYQPPVKLNLTKNAGNFAQEIPEFPCYDSPENFRHFKLPFEEMVTKNNLEIVVTEKIHGTNSRVGIVNGLLVAGSNKHRRKDPTNISPEEMGKSKYAGMNNDLIYSHELYWYPHSLPGVKNMLQTLGEKHKSVVLYGEIFGTGVQDFKYGRTTHDYRVFDIMIDGQYLDFKDALALCIEYDVEFVPILWIGEYNLEVIKRLTKGNTTLAEDDNKLTNIREGVVLKFVKELRHPKFGRCILKYISDDYSTNSKFQEKDSTDQ